MRILGFGRMVALVWFGQSGRTAGGPHPFSHLDIGDLRAQAAALGYEGLRQRAGLGW